MSAGMRPRPVIWFERVMLLAVALGILNTALEWNYLNAAMPPPLRGLPIIAQGIFFAAYLLLLWLISRRGSRIARWVFLVLVVAAVPLAIVSPPPTLSLGPVTASIAITQYLLSLVGLELIFKADAKPWFEGRRMPVDPEIFR